jgi:hypothetical protein
MKNDFRHAEALTNRHFNRPKPVDQFFTDRSDETKQLKNYLLPKSSEMQSGRHEKTHAKQKPFVIYDVID